MTAHVTSKQTSYARSVRDFIEYVVAVLLDAHAIGSRLEDPNFAHRANAVSEEKKC